MSSNPIRLQLLLRKYLGNSCSEEELREFWQLMAELSDEDLVAEELQTLWQNPHVSENTDLDRVFARLEQKVRAQDIDYEKIIAPRRHWLRPLMMAASLLACMALGWWLVGKKAGSAVAPVVTAKRLPGHQVINLPDGTVVTLNYDSKLDYPGAFTGKTREVYLTGEAFFDVKHDPTRQFLVHTGRLVTRVLGTSFNIKAYSNEDRIAVTVTSGKVQVQRTDSERPLGILSRGDQLVVGKGDSTAELGKADIAAVLDWKKEELAFDNMSFNEAFVLLGRHYGTELRFRNEALGNARFSADFTNYNLKQVLDIIAQMTCSSWHRENEGLVWFEGSGCK